MASAKDVRDILSLPQPSTDAPSDLPIPNQPFNLKLPPQPRNKSFNASTSASASTSTATATGGPSTLSAATSSKRSKETIEGIPRELYALIGDSAPSLAAVRKELGLDKTKTSGGIGFRERSKGKKNRVTWEWSLFTPAHHSATDLQLGHWRKKLDGIQLPDARDDGFAAYGHAEGSPNVMQYSQTEYEQHLTAPDWSAQETAYMFALLQAYDLRFHIVADRYAYLPQGGRSGQDQKYEWPPPLIPLKAGKGARIPTRDMRERRSTRSVGATPAPAESRYSTPIHSDDSSQRPGPIHSDVKRRTMEEIKHRYYSICRKLIRTRPAADEAVKEKLLRAYEFDKDREVARKNQANALFHLTKAQIQEEEALYVELKKMEQNERKYKAEREELMKLVAGLESGVFSPAGPAPPLGPNGEVVKIGPGNRVFSNGSGFGVGVSRTVDGVMIGGSSDKNKKRKRGDEGEMANGTPAEEPVEILPPPPPKRKQPDPMFDLHNNIQRIPPPAGVAHVSGRTVHVPAYLRSTKLPAAKPSTQMRVQEVLREFGVNPNRLIMPTIRNVNRLESLMNATQALVDMKKQVDRVETEVRILKAQKETAGHMGV